MAWWIWLIIVGIILLASIGILTWIIITSNRLVVLKNAVDRTFPLMNSKIKQYCESVSKLISYIERKTKKKTKALSNLKILVKNCLTAEGMINKALKQRELSNKVTDYATYIKGKKDFSESKRLKQLLEDINTLEQEVLKAINKHNQCAEKYNSLINKFPSNIISARFKFVESKTWDI